MAEPSDATTPPRTTARTNAIFCVLLSAIAVFYIATLRQGHVWADDFAMYIHHARNIADGLPYADTGYIYNPHFPVYGPRAYPPVFPLLLVPVYKLFGLNLTPMKVEQVGFILGTLVCVYLLWRRELGNYILALVAVLGFNPILWAAKDDITSDLPFLFFFYAAAVLAMQRAREATAGWRWGVVIGTVLYLATGTRVVGVSLVIGLAIYDIVRRRTVMLSTQVALAVWLAFMIAQKLLMGGGQGSYLDQLHPTAQTVLSNLSSYARNVAGFPAASVRSPFSYFVIGMAGLLALAGAGARWRRGLTMVETSLLPYVGILLLWPHAIGIRAMLPVVVWITFLALLGLREVADKLEPRHSALGIFGLLLVLAVPYAIAYRRTDFGPIRQQTSLPEFNQLCAQVREHTAPSDVIVFFRARALSLYTGRPAATFNYLGSEQELWQWIEQIHASYVITTDAFDDDHGFLARFAGTSAPNFNLVYENAHFKMYRVRTLTSTP